MPAKGGLAGWLMSTSDSNMRPKESLGRERWADELDARRFGENASREALELAKRANTPKREDWMA